LAPSILFGSPTYIQGWRLHIIWSIISGKTLIRLGEPLQVNLNTFYAFMVMIWRSEADGHHITPSLFHPERDASEKVSMYGINALNCQETQDDAHYYQGLDSNMTLTRPVEMLGFVGPQHSGISSNQTRTVLNTFLEPSHCQAKVYTTYGMSPSQVPGTVPLYPPSPRDLVLPMAEDAAFRKDLLSFQSRSSHGIKLRSISELRESTSSLSPA
jgi:hypothetical protein